MDEQATPLVFGKLPLLMSLPNKMTTTPLPNQPEKTNNQRL